MTKKEPAAVDAPSNPQIPALPFDAQIHTYSIIQGRDDRLFVRNRAEGWPWFPSTVRLVIQRAGGAIELGSGTLFQNRFVITCAHNVLHPEAGRATAIRADLAVVADAPIFSSVVSHFSINRGWQRPWAIENDIAFLYLSASVAANLMPKIPVQLLTINPAPGQQFLVCGYPKIYYGAPPFTEIDGKYCALDSGALQAGPNSAWHYSIDTSSGQSGAGILLVQQNAVYLVGVHSRGDRADSWGGEWGSINNGSQIVNGDAAHMTPMQPL